MLMTAAIAGMAGVIGIAVASAYYTIRLRKRIGYTIKKDIVDVGTTAEKFVLTRDEKNELEKVIHDQSLPVVITVKQLDKRKLEVSLKSEKYKKVKEPDMGKKLDMAEFSNELKRMLRYTIISSLTAIFAVILGFVSFYAISRPTSFLDLVAVATAPFLLLIAVLIPYSIRQLRKKLTR